MAITTMWFAWLSISLYKGWANQNLKAAAAKGALIRGLLLFSQAALPQAQAPSRGEGSTWLETLKNYGFDLISLFALALCALCLIVVKGDMYRALSMAFGSVNAPYHAT